MDEDASPRVQEALKEVADRLRGKGAGHREWTREVKLALCAAGNSMRYSTRSDAACATHGHQWLFDVCWLQYEGGDPDKSVRHVALAAESEWSPRDWEVQDDFQKLMISRAELRVMVFSVVDEVACEATISYLTQIATRFRMSERDRYLFAGYCFNTAAFRFKDVTISPQVGQ